MIFIRLFAVIATLFAGWRIWRRLRYFLHIFQLEGYKRNEFSQWVRNRFGQVVVRLSHKIGLGILAAASLGVSFLSSFWTALFALPGWTVSFASSRRYRSDQQKKPLQYTNRLKRLLGVAAGLTLVPVITGVVMGIRKKLKGLPAYLAGLFVADLGAPLWTYLAGLITEPVEGKVHEGFKRQARAKLKKRPDLQVVGITGSYGKTSTKFILAEILRQRYNVLATPSSYNTPMGICLVINDRLRPEHQVLVLEMGIRYPGDMDELCEIVRPDLAIETTVGVAHLESMGSIENIAHEKGKLLEHLLPDGSAVLNADDERVAAMAERAPDGVWRVSVEGKEADLTARNIRYDKEGATFEVQDDTGSEVTIKTRLLGKHNVVNILLSLAAGREMGLRLRQMAHAVARVKPVEHRLELRQEGDITIIDDAFNSNPVGARNAVEILGQFDTGRCVIVTPGMIELGERQYTENKALGRHIAHNDLDMALLVGKKQAGPIQDGLEESDFPADRTRVFDSLFDAQDFLKTYLKAGDVVLYENDLPDQYDS